MVGGVIWLVSAGLNTWRGCIFGSDGAPYAVHFLPLTSGARQKIGLDTEAVTVLFLQKSSIDVGSSIAAATQLYGLTPAEARVLSELVDRGGLAQIAAKLGISLHTVQTHLQHLFEKTGSNRQADLVKLVVGHQSPLHGR